MSFDLRWTRTAVSFALTLAVVITTLLTGALRADALTDGENRISFSRSIDKVWQIHTALPDGKSPRQLTSSEGNKCDPAMAPTGEEIAYVSGDALRVVPADGSGTETDIAVHDTEYVRGPTWSPTGDAIVYMGSIGYDSGAAASWSTELFRVTRTSTGGWSAPQQLTFEGNKALSPRFSPDGEQLAFSYISDPAKSSERDLYVASVTAAGLGEWAQVTTAAGTEHMPTWNPDGTHLLHTVCGGGVWTVEIATGAATKVGRVSACEAVWSTTDANRAVLEQNGKLSVLTLSNGRVSSVTPKKVSDRQPDW